MEQSEDTYKKFLINVRTKEDLGHLVEDIDLAKGNIYKGDQSISLYSKIEGKVLDSFRDSLAKAEKTGELPTAKKGQSELLIGLKKYAQKQPVCKLTLYFKPSREFLNKLTRWFDTKANRKVVFEIDIKEKIVGGAEIEFDGEYRDFTIGTSIDELLKKSNLGVEK